MKKKIDRIELDLKQVDALLERVKAVLPPEDYEIIKAMADTIHLLSRSVSRKAASIQRLLRMLFGAATEKLEKAARQKDPNPAEKKPAKGHGRKPAADYTGAEKIAVAHETLKPGDDCSRLTERQGLRVEDAQKDCAHHRKRPLERRGLRDAAAAMQPVRRHLHRQHPPEGVCQLAAKLSPAPVEHMGSPPFPIPNGLV